MWNKTRKMLFWTGIGLMGLICLCLTFGQLLPIKFADETLKTNFYAILTLSFPFSFLLLLPSILRQENSLIKNIAFTALLLVIAFFSSRVLLLFMMLIFQSHWVTHETIYRHKTENREIKLQIWDEGAFGYGEERCVEIRPWLRYWILTFPIDTTGLDKNNWIRVSETGRKEAFLLRYEQDQSI